MVATHPALSRRAASPVVERLVAKREGFLAFLVRRTGDPVAAEEILQEAYARGLDRAAQIRDPERAVAWFWRVLRNGVNDRFRAWGDARRRAASDGVDADGLPAPEAEEAADDRLLGCLHAGLDALPPAHALVLREVALGEQPLKDWAARAGLTANAAGVRMFRARASLRDWLERSCGDCVRSRCADCACEH